MSHPSRELGMDSATLLPHQAAFLDTVLDPAGAQVVVLRGKVGLGKTTAMVGVATRLLSDRPRARVLVICPAAARGHWLALLGARGAPAMMVDRYRYREMQESADTAEFWPRGTVILMSQEFAGQADIAAHLLREQWDLILADEAHRVARMRPDLLRDLEEVTWRLVLAIDPQVKLPVLSLRDNKNVIQWKRDRLRDLDGRTLRPVDRPAFHIVSFSASEAERELEAVVDELSRFLEIRNKPAFAALLVRALESSPSALEARLNALLTNARRSDIIDVDDDPGGRTPEALDPLTAEDATALAEGALDKLGATQLDSKLAAFAVLVKRLRSMNNGPSRICVVTEFLATLYYLSAEMEGLGIVCKLLHGGMPHGLREEILKSPGAGEWVVIATRAAISEVVAQPDATDLVIYEVPSSARTLEQLIGRFDRWGRTTQLQVHVLADSAQEGLLDWLGQVLNAELDGDVESRGPEKGSEVGK